MSGKQTYLRQQIEMRVNGLGWSDLATTWQQKGESLADSVRRLQIHLKEVLVEERVRERADRVRLDDLGVVVPDGPCVVLILLVCGRTLLDHDNVCVVVLRPDVEVDWAVVVASLRLPVDDSLGQLVVAGPPPRGRGHHV